MEKLIGIAIPDEIRAGAARFCKQYDPKPSEPLMTLLTPDKIQSVKGIDRKMQSFCLAQVPFKTVIGGPNLERSDKGTVLYLSVMMGPLNVVRDKLVKYLHIQGGEFFRAQLVLLSGGPDSGESFDKILISAKETFSKAQEFSVTSLAIYSRESESDRFELDSAYPFTGR